MKRILLVLTAFLMMINLAFAAIDINSASESELDKLPGIGPLRAKAIVEDRKANGPFKSPEDIKRVKGIGDKTFEELKSQITVRGGSVAAPSKPEIKPTAPPAAAAPTARVDAKPAAPLPVPAAAKPAPAAPVAAPAKPAGPVTVPTAPAAASAPAPAKPAGMPAAAVAASTAKAAADAKPASLPDSAKPAGLKKDAPKSADKPLAADKPVATDKPVDAKSATVAPKDKVKANATDKAEGAGKPN